MTGKKSNKTIVATMMLRRGYEKDMPVLREGELAFSVDTHKIFIGTSNGNMEVFSGIRDASKLEELENENRELKAEIYEIKASIDNLSKKSKVLERIDNADVNFLKKARLNGGK